MTAVTTAVVQTLVDTIKRECFTEGSKPSNADAFGLLMSSYFGYSSTILDAAARALEDANFHLDSAVVQEMADKYNHADDDLPMTPEHRKAVFAVLAERYGRNISRQRRLDIASKIVERPVLTFSTLPSVPMPVTRKEAGRILDVLTA